MAHRSDLAGAVSTALEQTPDDQVVNRELQNKARRAQAVSLAMSGMTYEQVGDSLGISAHAAKKLVKRTIEQTRNYAVDELRSLENARLDRAQAAIWEDVVKGDQQAIKLYLSIAERRARLNGLDAPSKVQMAVHVRAEMEQAIADLQQVVLEADDDGPSPDDVLQAEEALAFQHSSDSPNRNDAHQTSSQTSSQTGQSGQHDAADQHAPEDAEIVDDLQDSADSEASRAFYDPAEDQ